MSDCPKAEEARLRHLPSASRHPLPDRSECRLSLSFSVWTLPLRCETGQTLGLLSAFNYLYTSEVKLQYTPSTQGTGGSQSRGGSTAEERDQGLHTLARQAWRVICSHSCSTIIHPPRPPRRASSARLLMAGRGRESGCSALVRQP